MLFFSFLDLVYGIGFFLPSPQLKTNPGFVWLASVLPLWVWGTIWASVGTLLAIYAFRQKDSLAWAIAMTIKVIWGALYFLGALLATPHLDRGMITSTIWFGLAGLVAVISSWPEPDVRVVLRDD